MSKLFIFTLSFLSLNAYASPCSRHYSPSANQGIIDERTCTHQWKDKNINHFAEVILIKDGCRKFEGSEAQDCYLVRTCTDDPKTESNFSSAPLFDVKEELDHYCSFTKPQLRVVLGAYDESPRAPVVATIDCDNKKAVSITLKSPDKKSKVCPFR